MDGSHLLFLIIIAGLLIRSNVLRKQCNHWKESCKLYAEECNARARHDEMDEELQARLQVLNETDQLYEWTNKVEQASGNS